MKIHISNGVFCNLKSSWLSSSFFAGMSVAKICRVELASDLSPWQAAEGRSMHNMVSYRKAAMERAILCAKRDLFLRYN